MDLGKSLLKFIGITLVVGFFYGLMNSPKTSLTYLDRPGISYGQANDRGLSDSYIQGIAFGMVVAMIWSMFSKPEEKVNSNESKNQVEQTDSNQLDDSTEEV